MFEPYATLKTIQGWHHQGQTPGHVLWSAESGTCGRASQTGDLQNRHPSTSHFNLTVVMKNYKMVMKTHHSDWYNEGRYNMTVFEYDVARVETSTISSTISLYMLHMTIRGCVWKYCS